MAVNVIMPQLGESVVEGTISRWLVGEGDAVEQYAAILEVSTDKVDTEIPAPASGVVLRLYFPEGETVRTGQVIAVIGQPGEEVPDQPAETAPPPPAAAGPPLRPSVSLPSTPEVAHEHAPGASGRISPVVARIAREHGVDLSQVTGTGRDGRITKKDVLAHIDARDRQPPAEAALPAAEDAEELQPLGRLRRLIADHMVASKRTSAHVTTIMEVDWTAVVAHRAAHKDQFAAQEVRLTFMPYLVQAVIAGLKAVPQANAVLREDGLLLKRRYHIGVATAVPDGLVVPVIRDADNYSLLGLARQIGDLARRARAGQLTPDEVQGSTFTVTNHGTTGSLLATPIINQPNVAILGVGVIEKRPVVVSHGHPLEPSAEDSVAIRPMSYLSLTFDHRVLDGAGADGFLAAVKGALERWS